MQLCPVFHLEICRTTIVQGWFIVCITERTDNPAKVSCLKDQLLQLHWGCCSVFHPFNFGTQVRGTAFSPWHGWAKHAEHLHFESSQSCCSENQWPCCCQLEICRTTIVHCRMVHPFVSRKEQTILQPGSCWQGCLVSKTNCYNLQNIEVAAPGVFHPFTPMVPKLILFFFCTMYAWGLCPFLGMDIYSEKSLAPRNLSGINLGTTPVGTTHGDILPRCLVSKTNCYNLQTLKLRFSSVQMSWLSQMSSLSTCISKALSPACAVRIVRSEWHQTLVAVTLRFVGRRSFTAGWFIRLYHGKNRLSCQGVLSQRPIATTCKTLRLHPVFHPGFLLTLMMTWHCEGLCGQEDFLKLKHWKIDSEWYLLGREKMSLPRRDSSQKACRMNQTFTA